VILLGGIPSEGSLVFLSEALNELGVEYRLFNQRKCADSAVDLRIDGSGVQGTLDLNGEVLRLAEISGVFLRFMDDRILPELAGEPADSPARRHARAIHDALYRWLEVADARVVNRSDPQGSNSSKPYQAQLIAQHGFRVPPTLISNDPEAVLAFKAEHGAVIYKSMSGVRSIVKTLDEADTERLADIRWCPVQFQALVPGTDVRVHVIGTEAHATEISSDGVDYRYAKRAGGNTTLRAITLPDELIARCVALTAGLGLAFSGIDLRIGPDGEATCFEVNPSPAYAYYQSNTDQPIAMSVARYLAGMGGHA